MLFWPLEIPFSYPYNTLNFLVCTAAAAADDDDDYDDDDDDDDD